MPPFFLNLHAYWLLFFRIGLGIVRIFSSAFYPPSAFSHPRFILHPPFLIRVLSSIRLFSSVFSHPHPYPPSVSASVSAFYPYPVLYAYCGVVCLFRIRLDIIRVLSSIRIFSSAFYPLSAFSHPRFILHPPFFIRVLSSIRLFSSASVSAIRIRIRIRVLSLPLSKHVCKISTDFCQKRSTNCRTFLKMLQTLFSQAWLYCM